MRIRYTHNLLAQHRLMLNKPHLLQRFLKLGSRKMGRRGRFKLFLGFLVFIPIFTLCMVFGVEWSYVEKLKEGGEVVEGELKLKTRSHFPIGDRVPLGKVDMDVVREDREIDIKRPKKRSENELPKSREGEDREPLINTENKLINMTGGDLPKNLYVILRERKVRELRVEKSMREMWWYLRSQLDKPIHDNDLMFRLKDQYDSMRIHYEELGEVGTLKDEMFQLNWKYWQKKLSTDLTELMHKRIMFLQNPPDCDKAKKLVCSVAKTCGFGCQIHHVSYCFLMAYATKRTMILDSSNWRYSSDGWKAVFQPLSTTCNDYYGRSGQCVIFVV